MDEHGGGGGGDKKREKKSSLPVVPAGVFSLKYLTTSVLLQHFAFLARQRIHFLVSGSGRFSEASSSWRF